MSDKLTLVPEAYKLSETVLPSATNMNDPVITTDKVAEYYNIYSEGQNNIGINKRHRSILSWIKSFGLRESDNILEIGCGIGTVTQLLAKELQSGSITAIDISPESIELARKNLSRHKNVHLIAGDVISTNITGEYNIIVLPDVIEHIPIEIHPRLFEKLATLVAKGGYIFIHTPNPQYQVWAQQHTPELMQIIDQPIHTDMLCGAIYRHNLYIHFLSTYSIWMDNCDYQAIVIKPVEDATYKEKVPEIPPLHKRLIGKFARILRWNSKH